MTEKETSQEQADEVMPVPSYEQLKEIFLEDRAAYLEHLDQLKQQAMEDINLLTGYDFLVFYSDDLYDSYTSLLKALNKEIADTKALKGDD